MAVLSTKNEHLIPILYGILKAGAAYVPLDPELPAYRLRELVLLSEVEMLLSETAMRSKIREIDMDNLAVRQVVYLNQDSKGEQDEALPVAEVYAKDVAACAADDLECVNDPTDLASILFTSGTTGQPKGVLFHHQGIMNFVQSMVDEFEIGKEDRFVNAAPTNFDVAKFEIYIPLSIGGSVTLATPQEVRDPWRLLRLLERNRITVWGSVTTTWVMWLNAIDPQAVPDLALRLIFVGGESLPTASAQRSMALLPDAALYNVYGTTETTIWTTNGRVAGALKAGQDRYHAGKPLRGTSLLLLDDEMRPVSKGEIGEIFIGGQGVTHGYLNDPDRTAQSFLPNPFSGDANDRLYRTGDIGRLLPDGNLEVIGRKDLQVKIRGYRIELSEIENVLCQHPQIRQAAVAMQEDEQANKNLYGFLVVADANASIDDIRRFLSTRLPSYMIPHFLQIVEEIPTMLNGKTDRKALLRLIRPEEAPKQDKPAQATRTAAEIERTIANIWENVLSHREFRAEDSFFDVGGDSVKAVKAKMMLDQSFPDVIEVADLFAYPSVQTLSEYVKSKLGVTDEPVAEQTQDVHVEAALQTALESNHPEPVQAKEIAPTDIAVIGLGCRVPGGESLDEFWNTLAQGLDLVREIPSERWDKEKFYSANPFERNKTNCVSGGFLNQIDWFDAEFFQISAREAELMDPQQRLFLEVVVEALEHAGYGGQKLWNSRTGVFATASTSDYYLALMQYSLYDDSYAVLGNLQNMIANRISYHFNFTGPSVYVDTACSSSLVAVHEACRALIHGECDMALAGGVTLNVAPYRFIAASKMNIGSPTGLCRAFDERADGTVPGEGSGVVVLKPLAKALQDGDRVYAVIKGSATNHGGRAIGVTAPNPIAQETVVRAALQAAQVPAESISYIETHGTGTALGDPVEIRALAGAFKSRQKEKRSIAISSLKATMGHLGETAGIASFIKVVLALQNKQLPATLHFTRPNPELRLEDTPFYVTTELQDWLPAAGVRRAGVSSFGLGGTNVHVVVEEAPAQSAPQQEMERPAHVLTLAAKSRQALADKVKDLCSHLERNPDLSLADVCFTANTGRGHYACRLAFVAETLEDLVQQLSAVSEQDLQLAERPKGGQSEVLFQIPYDKPQELLKLARELYAVQPQFRENLHEVLLLPPSLTAEQMLAAETAAPPLLFAIGYATAKLWKSWVANTRIAGNGIGRYVAECLSGNRSVQEALAMVWNAQPLAHQEPESEGPEQASVVATVGSEGDGLAVSALFRQLALVYVQGIEVNWEAFDKGYVRKRVALPTYPFQRKRYWFEATEIDQPNIAPFLPGRGFKHDVLAMAETAAAAETDDRPAAVAFDLTQEAMEAMLTEAVKKMLTEPLAFDLDTELFDLDIDSLAAVELASTIGQAANVRITPQVIFDHPTIRELAMFIVEKAAEAK